MLFSGLFVKFHEDLNSIHRLREVTRGGKPMRFTDLLSSVKEMEAQEARRWMEGQPPESFTLLDVRQPEEYDGGHLPGAALIPLPQLEQRLGEIDPEKPVLVY
jgi:sulfur-carrier protein adenylyltransferase/sulfurtransferase